MRRMSPQFRLRALELLPLPRVRNSDCLGGPQARTAAPFRGLGRESGLPAFPSLEPP